MKKALDAAKQANPKAFYLVENTGLEPVTS